MRRSIVLQGCLAFYCSQKIPNDVTIETIEAILKGVPIPNNVDSSWHCRHWVWAGTEALVEHGVIPALPEGRSGEDIWNLGYAFVDSETDNREGDVLALEALPTCDWNGIKLKSEIGPL